MNPITPSSSFQSFSTHGQTFASSATSSYPPRHLPAHTQEQVLDLTSLDVMTLHSRCFQSLSLSLLSSIINWHQRNRSRFGGEAVDESRFGHVEFEVPGEQPTGDTQSAIGFVGVELGQEVETQSVAVGRRALGEMGLGARGRLPSQSS